MERVELCARRRKQTNPNGFFPINRNFCNFPLARDGHVRPHWEPSFHTGQLIVELPGDKSIWFQLPHGAKPQPLPNGFDMCVLFLLLRAARMAKTCTAKFRSRSSLLVNLGMNIRSEQVYNALKSSLRLWSILEINFDEWFDCDKREKMEDGKTKKIKGKGKIKYKLPSPIRSIRNDGRNLHVTLHETWIDISRRYFAKLPAALPTRAPAQNLILWLTTSATSGRIDDTRSITKSRTALYRAIGVCHGDRAVTLANAIATSVDWFNAHGGGKVEYMDLVDSRIMFMITKTDECPERKIPMRGAPHRKPVRAPRHDLRPIRVPATDGEGDPCFIWTTHDGKPLSDADSAVLERKRRERIGG